MIRTRLLSLSLAALALAISPPLARAQTQWNSYAPTYEVRPPAVRCYPRNAAAWRGYAPRIFGRRYAPVAGGRYYVAPPAPAPFQGVVAAPPGYGYGYDGRAIDSNTPSGPRNPEYGTGREVHMIKPWLPPAPR